MKCPVCIKQDLKSKLYGGDVGFRTAMGGGESYFDEDGVKHRHDPNKSSYSYSCSNGHRFSILRQNKCCDEWPALEEVVIGN